MGLRLFYKKFKIIWWKTRKIQKTQKHEKYKKTQKIVKIRKNTKKHKRPLPIFYFAAFYLDI
jgi:hypothetical protein